jgi:acyl-CoA hydrolase
MFGLTRFSRRAISVETGNLWKLMLPDDANLAGNVHGGALLQLIEQTGYIAATKYANISRPEALRVQQPLSAALVRVEHLDFLKPMHIGNLAQFAAQVTYVGPQVMEVIVTLPAQKIFFLLLFVYCSLHCLKLCCCFLSFHCSFFFSFFKNFHFNFFFYFVIFAGRGRCVCSKSAIGHHFQMQSRKNVVCRSSCTRSNCRQDQFITSLAEKHQIASCWTATSGWLCRRSRQATLRGDKKEACH